MDLSLLNDIKNGYTKINKSYIKHSCLEDEVYSEELYERFFNLALKRKIKTKEQAIKDAKKNASWTDENQRDLDSSSAFLSRIKENFDSAIEAQKKYLQSEIDSFTIKVNKLSFQKHLAIGKTAEDYASEMSNERFILSLFYKNQSLSEKKWSEDEVEYMDQSQVDICLNEFLSFRKKIKEDKMKELACSSFCQNLFYASGSDSKNLFGKNIIDMSCFQQRFCILLENYKNIRENIAGKVSDSILSNWKELESWAKSTELAREQLEKSWARGSHTQGNLTYENIRKASMVNNADESKEIQAIKKIIS